MYKTHDLVTVLNQIGPRQSENLAKLGINTLTDLLYHFPVYYKDTSEIVTLDKLNHESKQTVKVIIEELKNIRIRGGKSLQKGVVSDSSGSINVTWFNQQFITRALPIGSEVYMSGKLSSKSLKPELVGPDYEIVKTKNINLGKIVPTYRLTEGVSIKWLRTRLDDLITHLDQISDLKDPLPDKIKQDYQLVDLHTALTQVHTPESHNAIVLARKRLAFDELLQIYFKLIAEREARYASKSPVMKPFAKELQNFIATLPFSLTESQINAVAEIIMDLAKNHPMQRLLQGDVGSGKTIVALLTALPVIWSGYQVVILAPTTVLAQQHYETITKFVGKSVKTCLLTNTTAKSIKSKDKYQLIIATHSILYHQDLLNKLGLVIIDEQHRFGVKQRQELLNLKSAGITPHLLNLTATPIPRSIALTLFGEIEVSVIAKPSQRKVTQTHVVPQAKRSDAKAWIQSKLNEKAQIFWICPLIDAPDTEITALDADLKAVKEMGKTVKADFPKAKVGILHGKLKPDEKDKLIASFKEHKLDILVSTTVIEVGIDIPGANIIVIENAERYGLAQLHQLRGRVGRNNQDSWCFLFTGMESTPRVVERLSFFAKENNGIKIAEYDLQSRGPGEVYGTMQAGIPNLKIANFGNSEFLLQVREAAHKILNIKDKK